MVHKVIVPPKKIMSHSFLNSRTLLKWFFVKSFMLCLEISNSVMPRMGSCPPPSPPSPPPRLLYMGNEKRLLFKYCMRKNCFLEFIYFFHRCVLRLLASIMMFIATHNHDLALIMRNGQLGLIKRADLMQTDFIVNMSNYIG